MNTQRRGLLWTTYLVISVLILGLPAPRTATAADSPIVSVDWNDTRQSIDGFGGSGAFQKATVIKNVSEPTRSQILDLLFSPTNGIGLSIVRNMVGDGWTDPIGVGTIEPSEGVWDWTQDDGQIWLMQQAEARGVHTFFSTVWSQPAWMKTTNSVAYGSLRTDKYQAYADYLSRYVREYKTRFGIDISGISIQNEPDISLDSPTSLWSGEQLRDFIKEYLTPTFNRDAVTAQVILGECSCWNENFAFNTLTDPAARGQVQVVAAHHYGLPTSWFPLAKGYQKRVWQTEDSRFEQPNDPSIDDGLYWANKIHEHMTIAETNAWLQWELASDAQKTTGDSLLQINVAANTFTTNKRVYTIGNFSRFVRPGYVRIGATSSPVSGVGISSFRNPVDNTFVVVAVNQNTSSQALDIQFDGFTTGALTPYRTSATEELQQLSAIPANTGFAPTLAPRSVTTFVGIGTPNTLRPFINNNDPGISYQGDWGASSNRGLGDLGNDVAYTTTNGDSFQYTFTGSAIEYLAERNNDQGNLDIYLDNQFQFTVSAYSATRQVQQVIYSATGLAQGTHTLKVVKKSGQYALLDALNTVQPFVNDTDATSSYSGAWYYSPGRTFGDRNGDVHYTQTNGDSVQYSFTGTGIAYIAPRSSDTTTLDIFIDGQFQQTVNTANGFYQAQQELFQATNLGAGPHTIKIVKTSGNYAILDAFKVLGSAAAPPAGPTYTNDQHGSISYTDAWGYSPSRGLGDYNDDVHYTQSNDDYAMFTFTGTGVDYIAERNSDQGNVDVYLDNQFKGTVNTYNATRQGQQVIYSVSNLALGTHTLKIIKKSGQYALLDALVVRTN